MYFLLSFLFVFYLIPLVGSFAYQERGQWCPRLNSTLRGRSRGVVRKYVFASKGREFEGSFRVCFPYSRLE